MTTYPTLFVSGANGKLGRRVIELLLERNYPGKIIAGSRTPEKLGLAGVETRRADFTDKAGLVQALAGVDRLLIISTDQVGARLAGHLTAIEAARIAGVKEIAYTSMLNPEPPSAITFAPEHHGTEEALRASGVGYTILRNNWYAENLLGSLPNALASGQWYSSARAGRTSYVSREDCARAAAGALLRPATNQTYSITGPEALSTVEVARLASDLTGKPLAVVDVSDEQLAAGAKAGGVPDFVVEHFLVAFDRNAREGKVEQVTDAVETLWGEKPLSLTTFLEANKPALVQAA